ncbi:hypothetical protein [Limnothrix sp. PR1529]|uniref:hypothetical protein n=1 Tax=Limnothrix sp. PR1529 TaxID=1704291 RepID=UPI00117A8C5A|nr:hypothetical protein [Limnothrix sp. PR1529]
MNKLTPNDSTTFDDYEFSEEGKGHTAQKAILDGNFALLRGTKMLALSTGQGLLLKISIPYI